MSSVPLEPSKYEKKLLIKSHKMFLGVAHEPPNLLVTSPLWKALPSVDASCEIKWLKDHIRQFEVVSLIDSSISN